MNRREFVKVLGAGLGVVPLLGAGALAAPITQNKRGYAAGKFALELDGQIAGWLHSAEGGGASSDVVTEKLGSDHIAKKRLAGVKYAPISVDCGTGMSKAFYQWIQDSLNHKVVRKSGAVIGADYNYKETQRLNFANALITEIDFPDLDAASKDSARMTVTFLPEYTKAARTPGGGPTITSKFGIDSTVQKKWLPSNFRLKIDGCEQACQKVNKIEGIEIKQKVNNHAIGEKRDYEKEPSFLEIPNLVVTVAEAHSEPFNQWHEDFVIRGMNGDDKERNGTLEYLTPNLQDVLFTLTFKHLGIFSVEPEKLEAGSENIRRVKVSMYCEDLAFDAKQPSFA